MGEGRPRHDLLTRVIANSDNGAQGGWACFFKCRGFSSLKSIDLAKNLPIGQNNLQIRIIEKKEIQIRRNPS